MKMVLLAPPSVEAGIPVTRSPSDDPTFTTQDNAVTPAVGVATIRAPRVKFRRSAPDAVQAQVSRLLPAVATAQASAVGVPTALRLLAATGTRVSPCSLCGYATGRDAQVSAVWASNLRAQLVAPTGLATDAPEGSATRAREKKVRAVRMGKHLSPDAGP
jgi:hypothetical protein